MIYIVKYIEQDTIEGYVHDREQFLMWLRERNIERVRQQELSEYPDEFELIAVQELQNENS